MNTCHANEIALLIGMKWDLQDSLGNFRLTESKKEGHRKQLLESTYRIASIIDLYQNKNIRFLYGKHTYVLFSELVKQSTFDLAWEEPLVKQIFQLYDIEEIHVIDVRAIELQMKNNSECLRTSQC